jgi:hypothetical protein
MPGWSSAAAMSAPPHANILWMPTDQIVALLITERDKLNRAIEALQGPTKRRGRPPVTKVSAPGGLKYRHPTARKAHP